MGDSSTKSAPLCLPLRNPFPDPTSTASHALWSDFNGLAGAVQDGSPACQESLPSGRIEPQAMISTADIDRERTQGEECADTVVTPEMRHLICDPTNTSQQALVQIQKRYGDYKGGASAFGAAAPARRPAAQIRTAPVVAGNVSLPTAARFSAGARLVTARSVAEPITVPIQAQLSPNNPILKYLQIECQVCSDTQYRGTVAIFERVLAEANRLLAGRDPNRLSPQEFLGLLNTAIARAGYQFPASDENQPVLFENLADGKIGCNRAFFAVAIGSEWRMDVSLAMAGTSHVIAVWNRNGTSVNIDLGLSRIEPDSFYVDRYRLAPDCKVRSAYLSPLGLDQLQSVAYANIGAYYLQKDDPSSALNYYQRATAIDSNNAVAWYNMSTAAILTGANDKALAAAQRAVALDPNAPSAFNNLGLAAMRLNRLPEARSALSRALTLNPNDPNARYNMGLLEKPL